MDPDGVKMEQPISLTHAKQLLRDLEIRKDTKHPDVIQEYTNVLNMVVKAISKLSKDDDCSDTCSTLPETITTQSHSDYSSLRSVHHDDSSGVWIEDQTHDGESVYFEGKCDQSAQYSVDDDDDDDSVASDIMPLCMTDEDAIDEIDFCHEMMGYQYGSETMSIGRIEEEEVLEPYVPVKHSHRPPLPLSKLRPHRAPSPSRKDGHRRQNSNGSAPPVLDRSQYPRIVPKILASPVRSKRDALTKFSRMGRSEQDSNSLPPPVVTRDASKTYRNMRTKESTSSELRRSPHVQESMSLPKPVMDVSTMKEGQSRYVSRQDPRDVEVRSTEHTVEMRLSSPVVSRKEAKEVLSRTSGKGNVPAFVEAPRVHRTASNSTPIGKKEQQLAGLGRKSPIERNAIGRFGRLPSGHKQIAIPGAERRLRKYICTSCKRTNYEGAVCHCGMLEV